MGKTELVDRDLGWREFFARAREIKDSKVKVGVLADTSEGGAREVGPDGKPSSLTVAEIAVVNEFGTQDGRIPSRSFLRSAFDENREDLIRLGESLIERVLAGKVTVGQALGVLGASLANSAKRKITDGEGIPPPNAPSTVAEKGSNRPLVDTGRLVGAVTWSLDDSGETPEEE